MKHGANCRVLCKCPLSGQRNYFLFPVAEWVLDFGKSFSASVE